MKRIAAHIAALLAAFALGVAVGGVLPPPLDPWGDWFCCDSAGNCVLAVGSCSEGQWLVWCKVTGIDPATGQTICLD
jgi:hypothetical protein